MKRLNSTGFLGLLELAGIGVLVISVAFVSYRIAQVNNNVNDSLSSAERSSEDAAAQEIKLAQLNEAEEKEVDVPKQEAPVEEKPVEDKPISTEPTKTETKPTVIKFTKGGGSQQDDSVVVSANLESAQTGTCHFKFRLEGAEKVYLTDMISNSKVCDYSVPVSKFSQSGEWQFSLWFVSTDKTIEAYQSAYGIEVAL